MLLLPFIEYKRWKKTYGEVVNLNKKVTVLIAVAMWLLMCLFLKLYDWPVLAFAVSCVGIRGFFYDPALNLFMGRYIDAESGTTNSKADQFEHRKKISFWVQRWFYLGVAIAAGILYELIKRA